MKRKRAYRALRSAAVCALLLCAAAPAHAGLQELRMAWRGAQTVPQYTAVAIDLIDFRKERYAKTPEVDYMIATSLCRIPGREADAVDYFDWIMANYELGPDLGVVMGERSACGQVAAPQQVAFQIVPGQGGAANVHGKLYYWLDPSAAAVGVQPITIVRPMGAEDFSSRLFRRELVGDAVAATKARLGRQFTVIGTDFFVLATSSGQSDRQLATIASELEKFMSFYSAAYGLRLPSHLVTVYMVPGPRDMGEMAEGLHGIQIPAPVIGYSFRDDLSMVAIIPKTEIGTLAHELFHLMVRDEHGDIPPWLEEGIASLYEVSNVSGKYVPANQFASEDAPPLSEVDMGTPPMVGSTLAVAGKPNWRGCVLQHLWIQRLMGDSVVRPTIEQLAGMDWRAFNEPASNEPLAQQAVNFATARYLMLYLQDKRAADGQHLLFKMFPVIASRDPLDIKGAPADDARGRLADVLGPLEAVDREFEGWLTGQVTQQDCPG
jgi:hypothetical protein